MFDGHGVVGAAVDHTFRLAEAPPLKAALATLTGVCRLMTSAWFFDEVVRHHPDAQPELFRHIETQVKETLVSAYMRVPGESCSTSNLSHRRPWLSRWGRGSTAPRGGCRCRS